MRYLISFCVFVFLTSMAFGQEVSEDENVFSKRKISMGEVHHRDTAKVVFTYTNKSDKMKIILDTKTNCDCTWLEYPKSPIAPGKTVNLTVVYHAKDKGIYKKNIDILLSDNKRYKITVIGQVID